jgi:ketosteroid isomerase-like protein
MERSPEIESLVEEVAGAMQARDVAAMGRTLSTADGSVMIGSDAGEYMRDVGAALELMRDSMSEDSGMGFSFGEVRGYAEGSVGWWDGTGSWERDGQSVGFRMTGVAHREADGWRIVQAHVSIGVPNDRMFDPLFGG